MRAIRRQEKLKFIRLEMAVQRLTQCLIFVWIQSARFLAPEIDQQS